MAKTDFHDKPYDAGTLAKLRIFELYAQEWIPVFLSRPNPSFCEVHLFDFFCGPGTDSEGTYGSPLRILDQLRRYNRQGLAGWNKARIVAHLFDEDQRKIKLLRSVLKSKNWNIPGVEPDCRPLTFQNALAEYSSVLSNSRAAKLFIIDQYGVDAVSDDVFSGLISYPTTDFIFFLSSSTLHRFRDHPAIKQKIETVEDSYDVHRVAVDYYRKRIPANNQLYLGSFSIRKRSNIYGLIFGSHHPRGIHKFLQVAWATDGIAGEANFDIDRENIRPEEGILALDMMRPSKIRNFELELERALKSGSMKSESDVVRFCIEAGMICKYSMPVLKKLKDAGIIDIDFRVPDVGRWNSPRPISLIR
ncbi:MAG TPA: three-Cys-motif partner protein TcmP [Candidatus Acidoferrales bacterium]|nr:three-Cys-motif partner protein TcmP [Candidatus Acidoferrales bacterium]